MYFHYEPGMTVEDRTFGILTYRLSSKTFWYTFENPIYELTVGPYGIFSNGNLMPEMDYQVLRAKTNKEAKKRLMNVSSFLNRKIIKYLFGDLKPTFKEVKDKDAKDTGDLLMLSNGYYFEAAGIDQTVRGLNINNIRPKKILFDDVQNRENTKTDDRRRQCDREVMEESFPAVDDENGCLVYICNRVHEDDTGGKIINPKNTQWHKQYHTLTVKIIDGKKYPGDGDLTNEVPEWSQRWTIERIKKMRDWWVSQPDLGGMRGWLKEKYNIIKSDAEYEIRFHDAKYLRAFGNNWIVFDDREYINVDIVVACDPAISPRKASSDSVITAIAFAPDKRRFVLEESYGKYDINDRYHNINYTPANGSIALKDEVVNIKRKGVVGEMTRMILKYNAFGLSVETAATNETFFNELCNLLDKLAIPVTKFSYKGGGSSKEAKNEVTPLGYFELGLYNIRPNMTALKAEIDAFPYTKQDHLDALHIGEQLARFPTLIKYDPLGIRNPTEFDAIEPALTYNEGEGNRTRNLEEWMCTP